MESIVLVSLVVSLVSLLALKVYGTYLSFKKKWYIGVAALVIPFFALIVGGARYFFNSDLLK